jgi:hypothetical protein
MYLLLAALRDHLADSLSGLRLVSPACRGRAAALVPPRVLIGELPPRNQDAEHGPAADEGGYPVVLLRGEGGEDFEDVSTCGVLIVCAVAASERGEALEHEIQNLVAWTRTSLLRRRQLAAKFELIPDRDGRLLRWSIYPEYAHPYVAAQIQGVWRMPGVCLTEESYV